MNILIVKPRADRLDLSLCISGAGTECVIAGQVVSGATTTVELYDRQDGGALYHAELSAPITAGLPAVLAWLTSRHIRVDMVLHCIALHGRGDSLLRVSPRTQHIMAEFPQCAEVLAHVQSVTAAYPELPQFTHLSAREHTTAHLVVTLRSAGVSSPAGCPQKKKVRCETCCVPAAS